MVFCFTAAAATAAKALTVAKALAGAGAILISIQNIADNIKAYKS